MPDLSKIDAFIPRGSPLARAGGAAMLYRAAASVGRGDPYVGAAVMAALARKESSFGAQAFTPNNFWGWGIHAGPSVSQGPNPEVIAKRVWKGLTDPGGYYAKAKTIGEAINIYAPPSENDTGLYKSQVNSWLPSMGVDPAANFRGAGGAQTRRIASSAPATTRSFSPPGAVGGTTTWEPVPLSPEAEARINDYLLTSRLAVSDPKVGLPDVMPVYNFLESQPRWRAVAGPAPQQSKLPQTLTAEGTASPVQFTMGGGPGAHRSNRPLGNWQSDNAYDLMGKANDPVWAPVVGTVTKISGAPGTPRGPQFAGLGITVKTANGELFFKHLGTSNVKVGDQIRPGMVIGTLEPGTGGGPHLHLGGTNSAQLKRLATWYTSALRGSAAAQTGTPSADQQFAGTYGIPGASTGGEGGDWGGAMPRSLHLAKAVGATPSSQKRSRKHTATGGISDHWVGSTHSYATDLPTSGAAGDRLFRKVMQYLGQLSGNSRVASTSSGAWRSFSIGGYRYQVGWRVPGHYDHVHVGVERQ